MDVQIGDVVAVAPDFNAAPITPEDAEKFLAIRKPKVHSVGGHVSQHLVIDRATGKAAQLPGGEKILNRELVVRRTEETVRKNQEMVDAHVAVVGQALEGALGGKRLRVIQQFSNDTGGVTAGRVVQVTADDSIAVGGYVEFLPGDRAKQIHSARYRKLVASTPKQSVDAVLKPGDTVLVTGQLNSSDNGIRVVGDGLTLEKLASDFADFSGVDKATAARRIAGCVDPEMDPFDEDAADAFNKAMADGDVEVVTEGGGLVPGAIFEAYSDPSDPALDGGEWVDYDEAHEFALDSFKALDRAENPFAGQYKPGTGYDPVSGARPGQWTILRKGGAAPPDVDRTHTWHGWRERNGRIEILVRQRTDLPRKTRRARQELHAEIDEPRSFRPGLVHEPDPRCDCGNQKLGGRCNDPCPAAVPFHIPIGCGEHGIALEALLPCPSCIMAEDSGYCPGCQQCLACGQRNDDGLAQLLDCCWMNQDTDERCGKKADFEVAPTNEENTYSCAEHLGDMVPDDEETTLWPLDQIRCAPESRLTEMPF